MADEEALESSELSEIGAAEEPDPELSGPGNGTRRYASPNGTGDGSEGSPWDLMTAIEKIADGEVLILTAGTYELTRSLETEVPAPNGIAIQCLRGAILKHAGSGNHYPLVRITESNYGVYGCAFDKGTATDDNSASAITVQAGPSHPVSRIRLYNLTIKAGEKCNPSEDVNGNRIRYNTNGIVLAGDRDGRLSDVVISGSQVWGARNFENTDCTDRRDAHGILVGRYVSKVLLGQNQIFDIHGDGFQCSTEDSNGEFAARDSSYDLTLRDNTIEAIVGANNLEHQSENAVDLKACTRITIEGTDLGVQSFTGFRDTGDSSNGEAVVIHFGTHHVLMQNNLVDDSCRGVVIGKSSEASTHILLRYNVFRNEDTPSPCNGSGDATLVLTRYGNLEAHNNTFLEHENRIAIRLTESTPNPSGQAPGKFWDNLFAGSSPIGVLRPISWSNGAEFRFDANWYERDDVLFVHAGSDEDWWTWRDTWKQEGFESPNGIHTNRRGDPLLADRLLGVLDPSSQLRDIGRSVSNQGQAPSVPSCPPPDIGASELPCP